MSKQELVSEARMLKVEMYTTGGKKKTTLELLGDLVKAREERCKEYEDENIHRTVYIISYVCSLNRNTYQSTVFMRNNCTFKEAPKIAKRRLEQCFEDVKIIECIPTTIEYLVHSIRKGKYTFINGI